VIAVTDAVPSAAPTSKYAHLPEPVRLEDTVTSAEAQAVPEEKDEYWREVEWMLRVSGGG
jgi:hypothetical protein